MKLYDEKLLSDFKELLAKASSDQDLHERFYSLVGRCVDYVNSCVERREEAIATLGIEVGRRVPVRDECQMSTISKDLESVLGALDSADLKDRLMEYVHQSNGHDIALCLTKLSYSVNR